ncbi:MAG: hypothetical protein JF887_05460 [Candidatus Dormibacteraeota bacterium]|uniref:Uncharacterized protein n=1 Tax=Candidatus Amunia macphersoniae TaxID=3127014 RepID=A0A934KJF1_9BACT|nr:hypothetical protein [Candidatus Dormibacteraeota bacterium]
MAELPRFPNADRDTDTSAEHVSTTGRPRWVAVLGIGLAIALVVLVMVLHVTGVIGPGSH